MVSNLLFYIISNLNPHCSDANLQESRQLRKLVKIAWALRQGGAQTSTRVQTTTWWTWRKHECVAIIELQGETRKTVQGGASPPKMEVSNRTSGVRIIWVGNLGRGRNSWKVFKAKFGRDVKNAVLSLLLMARKIISFTSGTVNTITGIGIEIFCICVKQTVNSPQQQQPDDFLVTVKTLGRLLSYIFPTSVFTIYVLCCILFLSWGFYYEGFDNMSFYVWMHQCFNAYVLILLFYGVWNVWLIVHLPRFILIIEHSLSSPSPQTFHQSNSYS